MRRKNQNQTIADTVGRTTDSRSCTRFLGDESEEENEYNYRKTAGYSELATEFASLTVGTAGVRWGGNSWLEQQLLWAAFG